MNIKTSLKQLTIMFAQSASDEALQMPYRQFAARLTVLAAHVERVEAKIDAQKEAEARIDSQIAELAQLILASRPSTPTPPAAPQGEAAPAADGEASEEDEALALAAKLGAEAEAEERAAAAPVALVLPKSNKKPVAPPPTGDAS